MWITIRDLSSIFIIFALLYYSIRTILGVGGNSLKDLIVKIFIAGLLINFSLFFVRVAVDTSNLISLQFYNAIAPDTSQNWTVGKVFSDGGLSNVFMQSLKIPTIYKNAGVLKGSGGLDAATGIGFATFGGIIVMITASLSFLAASVAFIARTAIILLAMALSPVFFAGMIFPEIKKRVSDPLLDLLKGQLIFMPVYLALMYVALKIISDPNFMAIFNPNTSTGVDSSAFGPIWIGVLIQYAIALLFINAPLVAAISMGGMGMKWAPGSSGVNAVNKWLGGKAAGFASGVGQHTFGRAAKYTSDTLKSSEFAAKNPNFAVLASKGLGKVSGASFSGSKGGYDKKFKDYVKDRTELGKNIGVSNKDERAHVSSGIKEWDSKTEAIRKALNETRGDLLTSSGETAIELRKKLNKLGGELSAREKAKDKGEITDYLEKEILNQRKELVAKNLEEKGSFLTGSREIGSITHKARKDAAKAIRKEMRKGKKDKVLESIMDLVEDEGKSGKGGEGEAEKPKVT